MKLAALALLLCAAATAQNQPSVTYFVQVIDATKLASFGVPVATGTDDSVLVLATSSAPVMAFCATVTYTDGGAPITSTACAPRASSGYTLLSFQCPSDAGNVDIQRVSVQALAPVQSAFSERPSIMR